VHYGVLSQDINVRRGRGRPYMGETMKRDLKGWNVPRDLCLDSTVWKEAIDVHEPWLGAHVGFQL